MDPKEIRKRRARKLQGRRTGVARALSTLISIYVDTGTISAEGIEALQDTAEEFERVDRLTEEAEEHARNVARVPHIA
jgi:hypothetical protein